METCNFERDLVLPSPSGKFHIYPIYYPFQQQLRFCLQNLFWVSLGIRFRQVGRSGRIQEVLGEKKYELKKSEIENENQIRIFC